MLAFTSLSYDGMGIGNGQDASMQYAMFMQGVLSLEEQTLLWQNLTAYCGLDIIVMKTIVDVLKEKAAI